jgi:aminoglycoside phosphotransferase (APT) family kinase protein
VTRPAPPDDEQIRALLRAACPGSRLLRAWPLTGATGSQVTAIETVRPDGRRQVLVLRQYGEANLRADPHAADTEARLLRLLLAAGLPVPRPYLADESGSIVPGPWLLQDYIDGERIDDPADLADFTGQLAAVLARLHDISVTTVDVPFLAPVSDGVALRMGTAVPGAGGFGNEPAIRAALRASWPPPAANRPAVLHGDYWPGNVLWRDGTLVGVVDWEDAAFGDPLADLAITRLEVGWFHGAAAMDLLTRQYQELRPQADLSALPLWDLQAALRACAFPLPDWGMPEEQVAAMRAAHGDFAADALSRL